MASTIRLFLLIALSAFCTTVRGADVFFVDSSQGTYLRPQQSKQADPFSPATVIAANAVLLGLDIPSSLDKKSASQLDALLAPNAFKRPGSVAIFAIFGLPASFGKENTLAGLESWTSRSLATPLHDVAKSLAEETLAATSLLHELGKLRSLAGDELSFESLKCDVAHACHGECLDRELTTLAEVTGGSYKVGAKAGYGIFTVKGHEDTPLNLEEVADQALALELACFTRVSVDVASTASKLVYVSSTSMQTFGNEYGVDSKKFSAAASLLLATVSKAVRHLQESQNGRLAATVALLGDAPEETIYGWDSERSVRQLLTTDVDDSSALVKNVVVGATVFILIVAIILGSCALFCMSITKDTLLYTSAKLD